MVKISITSTYLVHTTHKPLPLISGFTYSMHCPPSFPVRMRNCYNIFVKTKMALYTSMLAVIRGTTSKLDEWCK